MSTKPVSPADFPPSPPPDSFKHRSSQQPFPSCTDDHAPRITSPSPLMSFSPQNYASNSSATQSTSPAQTAPQSTQLSSPSPSITMSSQTVQQHPVMTTNAFPTPASSIGGAPKDPADTLEKAGRSLITGKEISPGSGNMEDDLAQNQSDQKLQGDITRHSSANDDAGGDAMDLDSKENDGTSGDLTLESLQKDIGTAFHLCKNSYTMTGPNPAIDLVSLYGLGPVASSVARTDPITGEKINRLRKSYEGKIKGFGLAGRNKPVKREVGAPGSLRSLMMWPEEEWHNQKVIGKEIKVAEPDSEFYKQQMKAMKLEPGPVPNNEYWEDILGHEKSAKASTATAEQSLKKPSFQAPETLRTTSQSNGTTPTAEASRPKRTGKKRSYNDSSFIGYGEGFPDDDTELDGNLYSNSEEGSRDLGKKKRKKLDHSTGGPLNDRSGSYGVGMFGIGAR